MSSKGNRTVQVRVDDLTRERWEAKAAALGVTVPELVRQVVDHALADVEGSPLVVSPSAPVVVVSVPAGTKVRTAKAPCRNAQRHVKGVRCGYCHAVP